MIQARKYVPIERLEHLRSQLGSTPDPELSAQLEQVIGKLEPPDSASSSRRSSISSHVCRPVVPLIAPSGPMVTGAAFPGELQRPGLRDLSRDQPQREPVGGGDGLPHQPLRVGGGAAEGVQLHAGRGPDGSW